MFRRVCNIVYDCFRYGLTNDRALLVATQSGNLEKVKEFVRNGANIEAEDQPGFGRDKSRPLHYAARFGHAEILTWLIRHNAQINIHNDANLWTPLHLAAMGGHAQCVRILLEHGADSYARGWNQSTAIDAGIEHEAVLNVFVEKHVDLHRVQTCNVDKITAFAQRRGIALHFRRDQERRLSVWDPAPREIYSPDQVAEQLLVHPGPVFILLPESIDVFQGWRYVEAIAEVLLTHEHHPVTRLVLDDCNVSSRGIASIAMLITNNKLSHLSLKRNNLSNQAIIDLAHSLLYSNTLVSLNIHYNCIFRAGAQALAEVIEQNPSLMHLDVSCNPLDIDGFLAIARAKEGSFPDEGFINLYDTNETQQLQRDYAHVKSIQYVNDDLDRSWMYPPYKNPWDGLLRERERLLELSREQVHERRGPPVSIAEPEHVIIEPYTNIVIHRPFSRFISSRICVLASNSAYLKTKDPQLPRGWSVALESGLSDYGYFGLVLRHVSGTMIIAHRGTEARLFKNLMTDALLALDNTFGYQLFPESCKEALAFSHRVRSHFQDCPQFIETGHSLGGFYAELNAYIFNDKSITFDSPGTKKLLSNEGFRGFLKSCACRKLGVSPASIPDVVTEENYTSFVSSPNIVNTLGGHIGPNVFRLYSRHVPEEGYTVDDLIYGLLNIPVLASFSRVFFNRLAQRESLSHSLKHLSNCFDRDSGEPYLQRKVWSWPSTTQYLGFFQAPQTKQYWKYFITRVFNSMKSANLAYERLIHNTTGYVVTDFVAPALGDRSIHSIFTARMDTTFEEFYEGDAFKQRLIQTVNPHVNPAAGAQESHEAQESQDA